MEIFIGGVYKFGFLIRGITVFMEKFLYYFLFTSNWLFAQSVTPEVVGRVRSAKAI